MPRAAAAVTCALLLLTLGCSADTLDFDPPVAIGVENQDGALVVHVRTCGDRAIHAVEVGEAYGLDDEPERAGAAVYWRIESREADTDAQDLEAEVGSVPPGFDEVTPLSGSLPQDRRVSAAATLDDGTEEAVSFSLAEIPDGQLKSQSGRVQDVDAWTPRPNC